MGIDRDTHTTTSPDVNIMFIRCSYREFNEICNMSYIWGLNLVSMEVHGVIGSQLSVPRTNFVSPIYNGSLPHTNSTICHK